MARKAQIMKYTVILILLFLFLFFFLLFEGTVFSKSKELQQINSCRNSVMLSPYKQPAAMKQVIGKDVPPETSGIELDCPVIYKTIQEYGGDNQYINKILADHMASAWYKFNEGESDLFANIKGEVTNYCVVRSVIKFEGAEKGHDVDGLLKFMTEHPIPKMFGTGTYMEYLTGVATDEDMKSEIKSQLDAQKLDIIDTNSDYVVLFFYPKKGYTSKIEAAEAGAFAGGAVGFMLTKLANFFPQTKAFSWVFGKKLMVLTTTAGAAIGAFYGHDTGYEYGAQVLLMPYNEELLDNLACEMPVPLGYRPY